MTDSEKNTYQQKISALEIENLHLKERLEFHELYMENSNSWETFRDASGKLLFVSRNIEQILGLSREDYQSGEIAFLDYVYPEDIETAKEKFQQQLDRKFIRNYLVRVYDINKNLKYLLVSSKPVYNINNEYIGFRTSISDITEQKNAEIALQESENQLNEIFDNSLDNIFIIEVCLNNRFRVLRINSALAKIFCTDKENIEGKFIDELVNSADADKISQNYMKCIEQRGVIKYDEVTDVPGIKIYYSTHLFPLFDKKGNVPRLIGISRDITNRIKSEQALKENEIRLNELNADKDKFFQILSHDLRNPFNQILGFSDILLKKFREFDKDKIEDQLSIINQTARTTYQLLEDILIWSKSQSGKLTFSPREIYLNEVSNLLIKSFHLEIKTKHISVNYFESEEICIMADLEMLKTILRNLLSNAIKFTHDNGHINIYAEKSNEEATITVSDNGIGIDSNNINKIWGIGGQYISVGTSGEKGSGLGLFLCKEFVEKHGGKIWVESELGKGCEIKFTMPLSR
jgi:PAS domain S-box-containing protein